MKIFFCAHYNPAYWTVTEYTERALRRSGAEVVSFEFRSYRMPGRIRAWSAPLQAWDQGRLNDRLLHSIRNFNPDLILTQWNLHVKPETWRAVRAMSIPVACWFMDYPGDPGYVEAAETSGDVFNHYFCQSTDMLERMRAAGHQRGSFLPVAADPEIHHPVEIERSLGGMLRASVVFVGSYYPEREQLLNAFTDFKLGIWGPDWHARLSLNSPLRPFLRRGGTKPQEWRGIYSAAGVVLSLTGSGGKDFPKEKVHQVSPRTFEALACGGFYLVERKKDLETLFQDKKHLVMFDSERHAADLARYYLEHPQERSRIANAGREFVLARHTYDHRVREMIDVLKRTENIR